MSDPGEPLHEGRKSGVPWLDLVIAITALLISTTSLVVAIVHSRTLERMADANARLVEANSWPFLSYTTSNYEESSAAIILGFANNGVGPAKVETVEISWKKTPEATAEDFLRDCCGYVPDKANGLQRSLPTGVVRAGERVNFFVLPKTAADSSAWEKLNAARTNKDLSVDVCYCSVFDECWKDDIARFSLTPKRVDRCETPKTPFGIPR